MNTMKKTMIGLCAAFACVSIAKASQDTIAYDLAVYDTTDYTMEAIEAAQSKVTGGIRDGITQEQVDKAQAILDVGGIRTGVTQADINLNISIVDNAQEMVDLAYITDQAILTDISTGNYTTALGDINSDAEGAHSSGNMINLVDSLLKGLGTDTTDELSKISATSTILPIPVDNLPDGLAELLSDAVDAAKFIVDGDVDEDGFGLVEPDVLAEEYIVYDEQEVPVAIDDKSGDKNKDYIADKAEFDESLLVAQTNAKDAAEAANKAVMDAIIAANAVYESIAGPQAIIDVGVLSTITAENINEAWETTVLGVRVKTTQEQVDAAQEIVDAGLTVENTSFSFSKNTTVSRELYEYAKTVVRYTEQSLFKKSKYTSSDISKAEAIVTAGVIEAITENQYNSAVSYVDMANLPDEALPSVVEAEALLKKGVTTGVTQAKLNVAQSVVDAQKVITDVGAVSGSATSRDPVTQATVNKNIELLNLLTYAAKHFGTTTGTLGSNFEFENGEIDLETMQAIIELAEAQILVETGVMAGVTQADIDEAQAILDASVIKEVTQVQLDKAQAIVTLGLVEEVTQADIDEAQAIIDAGLVEGVTQADIDAAQVKVDAGLVEGVTQADIDAAQAKVDTGAEETQEQTLAKVEALVAAGLVEGATEEQFAEAVEAQATIESITAEKLAEAKDLVTGGLVEGVTTQEDLDKAQTTIETNAEDERVRKLNMQVLVSNGVSIEDLTPEQIVRLRGVKEQYDTTFGEEVVQDVIDIYNIDGDDLDAYLIVTGNTSSSNDKDIVHDEKFVRHGGIDSVKALVKTGNVETALKVLSQFEKKTLTIHDFVTKTQPDVSSSVSGSTAGVNVVGGAIGGHQQSVVASSGKYGLRKHSLSVSKQLGLSSGDGSNNTGAWLKVFGSDSEMDMRDSVPGYDADASGVVVGIDRTFGDLTLGAAISVANIDVDGKSIANSKTDSDQYQGTLYGTMMMESFYINGSLAYGHASSDTSRNGLDGVVTGSYDTGIFAASLGIGVPVDMGSMAIIPQATMSYATISPDDYTESGIGALRVNTENMDSFGIKAGVAVISTFAFGGGVIAPQVRLMADWDISQEKSVVNSSWVGDVDNTVYSTSGAEPASLGAIIGTGFDYASDDGAYVLSMGYDLSTRSDFVSHTGSAKFRVNF